MIVVAKFSLIAFLLLAASIKITLHGLRGPIQVGEKIYDREMPGLGRRLSDREMAALLSFVRNRWGASSAAITPAAVTRVRTEARNRQRYWTVEELVVVILKNTPPLRQ